MTVDIRSIRRHLDSLRGVLTDDESAELDRLMQKHDRATALEVHAETAVSTVAESVAASLPAGASDAGSGRPSRSSAARVRSIA